MPHKHHSHGHHSHGHSLKSSNPDKGPRMMEGAHHFDKGYVSDNDYFAPKTEYPGDHERGNHYMHMQNEIVSKDSKKLRRDKFTKIA